MDIPEERGCMQPTQKAGGRRGRHSRQSVRAQARHACRPDPVGVSGVVNAQAAAALLCAAPSLTRAAAPRPLPHSNLVACRNFAAAASLTRSPPSPVLQVRTQPAACRQRPPTPCAIAHASISIVIMHSSSHFFFLSRQDRSQSDPNLHQQAPGEIDDWGW